MSKYDEYVEACENEGVTPKTRDEWMLERLAAGRQAAKEKATEPGMTMKAEDILETAHPGEAGARVTAVTADTITVERTATQTAPDRVIFWCEMGENVQIMQAGRKLVVEGQLVTRDHRTIEFTRHHWTADMHNPDHVEKVEWLRQCDDLRRGRIREVPDFQVLRDTVRVRTGPRVTGDRTPVMPQPTSPAAALTAPLK